MWLIWRRVRDPAHGRCDEGGGLAGGGGFLSKRGFWDRRLKVAEGRPGAARPAA